MTKMEYVRVELNLDKDLPEEEKKARIRMVQKVLTQEGGRILRRYSFHELDFIRHIFIGRVSAEVKNRHHRFDRALNKSYPEGAGAASVEDTLPPE